MNCHYCILDLSGATATLPCCARQVHTACLIKDISFRLENDFAYVQCECGVNIWETQYEHHEYSTQGSVDARVATLLAQPGVRQEVKDIKKAGSVMAKTHRAFNSNIKGIKTLFKEQSAQHVVALKQLRDATKSSIVQSAEYKAHRRARNAINILQKKFREKYSLSSREYRHILGYANSAMPTWNYRYYTAERILRRLLRIVI
jgi:hypothetical protein